MYRHNYPARITFYFSQIDLTDEFISVTSDKLDTIHQTGDIFGHRADRYHAVLEEYRRHRDHLVQQLEVAKSRAAESAVMTPCACSMAGEGENRGGVVIVNGSRPPCPCLRSVSCPPTSVVGFAGDGSSLDGVSGLQQQDQQAGTVGSPGPTEYSGPPGQAGAPEHFEHRLEPRAAFEEQLAAVSATEGLWPRPDPEAGGSKKKRTRRRKKNKKKRRGSNTTNTNAFGDRVGNGGAQWTEEMDKLPEELRATWREKIACPSSCVAAPALAWDDDTCEGSETIS